MRAGRQGLVPPCRLARMAAHPRCRPTTLGLTGRRPSTLSHGSQRPAVRGQARRPTGGCAAMRIVLAWLRLDSRRRWRSLAILGLLMALATMTVLTAVAGARRGQTAFSRLWARTLPATITVLPNQPRFHWARVRVRIVGVIRSFWFADSPGSSGALVPSPALLARYRANLMGSRGDTYINALVRLKGGAAAIPAFRADLARVTHRSDIDVGNNYVDFV